MLTVELGATLSSCQIARKRIAAYARELPGNVDLLAVKLCVSEAVATAIHYRGSSGRGRVRLDAGVNGDDNLKVTVQADADEESPASRSANGFAHALMVRLADRVRLHESPDTGLRIELRFGVESGDLVDP